MCCVRVPRNAYMTITSNYMDARKSHGEGVVKGHRSDSQRESAKKLRTQLATR